MKRIHGIIISAFLISSCGFSDSFVMRKHLKSFMSETVTVPHGLQGIDSSGISYYKDTLLLPKLVIYYDSSACNDCEVSHLTDMEWLYRKSARSKAFEVLIIFSPIPEEYTALRNMLEVHDFPYPVYIDFDGRFRRANRFIPSDVIFHSFLIDASGKILYVGNPSLSSELSEAFERSLSTLKVSR